MEEEMVTIPVYWIEQLAGMATRIDQSIENGNSYENQLKVMLGFISSVNEITKQAK